MKKGDIIRLDITGYNGASNEVFETTDEAVAKEKNIWHEGHTYKPRVYILGGESSDYPTGLELDLLKAKVGDKRSVNLEAKDAYGAHNPLLVETISVRELIRQGVEPEVGATIQRRNRTGYIAGIFGGRVRVDYNHRMAGKPLKYDYTVRAIEDASAGKVAALLDLHYGRSEEFRISIDGKSVNITVPDVCKFDQAWATQKLRVVLDLREHAGFETVSYVEEYVKKKAEEKEEEKSEDKAEEAHADHGHKHEAGEAHHEHEHKEPAAKPAKAAKVKAKAPEAK
jgi:FKBP-type peptidyl-prolyl cis-trans isomerase 2